MSHFQLMCLRVCGFALHVLWSMLACSSDHDATAALALAQATSQFVVTEVSIAKPLVHSPDAAPTPMAEVVRVLGLLPTPQVGFADLGCGDGRWLLAAAEKWPGVRITGVEIDPARAAATRERVQAAGLSRRIEVITGDVLTTAVEADVATAYLYHSILDKLVPRVKPMRAFASYMHEPVGLGAVRNGDTWIYMQPFHVAAARPAAVWGGQLYSHPQCNNPRCGMCASIRSQLAAPVVVQVPKVEPSKAAASVPQKAASGHWVKRCQNGRCWMEWISN